MFETAPEFEKVDKAALVDSQGRSYAEFRRALRPRYAVVWSQIALTWMVLFAIAWGVERFDGGVLGPVADRALGIVFGALAFGYALAFLHLFVHEAAHWNLAPSRRWNDLLTNVFVGGVLGLDVKTYRPIHWEHHKHLGTPQDTERSYFEALNLRFVVESLTGLRVLRVLATRKQGAAFSAADPGPAPRSRHQPWLALIFHLVLLVLLAGIGAWSSAVAWVLGVGTVFPFFASVRQVLEHRSQDADPAVDYAKQSHGAVNKLFGSGPLASTLGGAGFNRHLLHHWEPQLSCTRLAELERFLEGTGLSRALQDHRTTYAREFLRLFGARPARRGARN